MFIVSSDPKELDRSQYRVESTGGDPYAHVQLPMGNSTTIRLLEILPAASEDDTAIISCKLHLASMSDSYVALSYMWGTEEGQMAIELNGIKVNVRRNLWDFLHQARIDQRTDGTLMLWIDALVIQQNMVSERNHQVALMGSIYSRAKSVLIWLGVESEPLMCFEHLDEIEDDLSWYTYFSRRQKTEEELNLFINHEYWSRAWILQECVLPNTLQLRCRSRRIPGTSLHKLHHYLGAKTGTISATSNPFFTVFEARINWHQGKPGTRNVEPFGDIKPACSDPRDRIYSKLSIMDNSMGLVPDYNKSSLELFIRLADSYIHWGPDRSLQLRELAYTLDLLDEDYSQGSGRDEWNPAIRSRIVAAEECKGWGNGIVDSLGYSQRYRSDPLMLANYSSEESYIRANAILDYVRDVCPDAL
jgi:hypothetical protein